MKKQILVIPMLLLALIFFSANQSFAQTPLNVENGYLSGAPTCPGAIPLTCATGDGLTPVPGVVYPYTITVTSSQSVYWFVTDDADNIMTAPSTFTGVMDPGDGSGNYILTSDAPYGDPLNNLLTVNISWKPFNGTANEVLLVAYVINGAGCTDNIEVWRIVPNYSFTLDLAGVLDDGSAGATECPGNIQSAAYDGTNLNVIYGDNYVFFAVTAANWQTSWQTTISAATDLGTSGITSVDWAYADEANDPATIWNASGTPVLASHYGSTTGFIDEACIIVRVLVDHSAAENLTAETITLSVDGNMEDPETPGSYTGYPDLDEGASGQPCVTDHTDTFDYIISPRPDIDPGVPGPFEPKVPTEG